MAERAINSFFKGLYQDASIRNQPKGTYRDSLNGTILFKDDGAYTWNNEKGNSLAFSMTSGYIAYGYAEFTNKLVVLSGNGVNSEIGYVDYSAGKETGTYTRLFNDQFDPFGDKLNFTKRIRVVPVAETGEDPSNENNIKKIYWTDDDEIPRQFNILAADNAVVPFDPVNGPYPDSYSVQSMALQGEFDMGEINFHSQISGSLLSGQYQYTYRLINDNGYATPWIPITRPYFVTDTPKDSSNWNTYRMTAVQASTGKGNKILVTIYDNRYTKFEVAAVYSISNAAPLSASIFFTGTIGTGLFGASTTDHEVNHTSMSGTSVNPSTLLQQFIAIEKAKEITTKDNILFLGNIKEQENPKLSSTRLSLIDIRPYFRRMRSDELGLSTGRPYTNQTTRTKTSDKKWFYNNNTASYVNKTLYIEDDYENYKGVQVDNQYLGYFRAETYRFGIVFYNKKGQPGFVQHIADITFPSIEGPDDRTRFFVERLDSSGNPISLTWFMTTIGTGETLITPTYLGGTDKPTYITDGLSGDDLSITNNGLATNAYDLRIMGLEFRNIQIEDIVDDITGFAIVRAKRSPRILHQGIFLNGVYESGAASATGYPQPSGYNLFGASAGAAGSLGTYYIDGFGGEIGGSSGSYFARDRTFILESPDFMAGSIPSLSSTHKIKIVGSLFGIGASGFESAQDGSVPDSHYYVKPWANFPSGTGNTHGFRADVTSATDSAIDSEHALDSLTTLPFIGTEVLGYDPSNPTFIFKNRFGPVGNGARLVNYTANHNMASYGHKNSMLIVTSSLKNCMPSNDFVGLIGLRYCIANYIDTNGGTYGGLEESALAGTIYESIGEFRPLNYTDATNILDKIKHPGVGNEHVWDRTEVWGGDCYLDYYALMRRHSDTEDSEPASNGVVFPVESVNNHMIYRTGENFAELGASPVYSDGFFVNAGAGTNKIEDYTHLSLSEQNEDFSLFVAKPTSLLINTDFPFRWVWSLEKNYGESIDSFTQFPLANFKDMEGTYGEIVSSILLFDRLYAFQENGFALCSVGDREMVSSDAGSQIVIGSGAVMDRFDYISKEYGIQHQFSMTKSSNNVYWFDAKKGKILSFGNSAFSILSDELGLHDFCDNISKSFINSNDIHSGFDFKNGNVFMTFIKNSGTPIRQTISYNEKIKAFISFHSYIPNIYMMFGDSLFSDRGYTTGTFTNPHQVYVHNIGAEGNFYGVLYPAKLAIISNDNSMHYKVFDNAVINPGFDITTILNTVVMETEEGTQTITMPDNRVRYREGLVRFPTRGLTDSSRVKGVAAKITLNFNNDGVNKVAISDVQTIFRFSRKI